MSTSKIPDMEALACNLNNLDMEEEGSVVHGQSWLCIEFGASLGYTKPVSINKANKRISQKN